nr:hypothetical protein [Methanobrevibacter sp. TLL-48-HuF1]
MDKPYGLTMRGIVKNKDNEILILRRYVCFKKMQLKFDTKKILEDLNYACIY